MGECTHCIRLAGPSWDCPTCTLRNYRGSKCDACGDAPALPKTSSPSSSGGKGEANTKARTHPRTPSHRHAHSSPSCSLVHRVATRPRQRHAHTLTHPHTGHSQHTGTSRRSQGPTAPHRQTERQKDSQPDNPTVRQTERDTPSVPSPCWLFCSGGFRPRRIYRLGDTDGQETI